MPGSHFILKKISIDILQSAAVNRDLSASSNYLRWNLQHCITKITESQHRQNIIQQV